MWFHLKLNKYIKRGNRKVSSGFEFDLILWDYDRKGIEYLIDIIEIVNKLSFTWDGYTTGSLDKNNEVFGIAKINWRIRA